MNSEHRNGKRPGSVGENETQRLRAQQMSGADQTAADADQTSSDADRFGRPALVN